MLWVFILIRFAFLAGCHDYASAICVDIDSAACTLMATTNPRLCSDPALSATACPKFCNKCPLECYHCDAILDATQTCNTTKQCVPGQVCMKKAVTSLVDGHHEYQLTCESRDHCDGRNLLLLFGKRRVIARDVSVTCCVHDRCNQPDVAATAPPTTPALHHMTMPLVTSSAQSRTVDTTTAQPCLKDVIVLQEDKHGQQVVEDDIRYFLSRIFYNVHICQDGVLVSFAKFYRNFHKTCMKDVIVVQEDKHGQQVVEGEIRDFLSSIFYNVHIGQDGVLVSFAKFKSDVNAAWNLDKFTDWASLQAAINNISAIGHNDHANVDMSTALSFVLSNQTAQGNRPGVDDVILFMTTEVGTDVDGNRKLISDLRSQYDNVIVIGIGHHVDKDGLRAFATDGGHEFTVKRTSDLNKVWKDVLALICPQIQL